MYLIVGLGNPGAKYRNTRHNVGFMAVDLLAERHHIKISKLRFKALVGEGNIGGEKAVLIKPQTFMNLSGESVYMAKEYYKTENRNVIIVYDDMAFGLGDCRIKPSGSDGGHNGMKHIIYMLRSDIFPRVRIGIGGKAHEEQALADHVLSSFTKDDYLPLKNSIENAVLGIEMILKEGLDSAMNKYNRKE